MRFPALLVLYSGTLFSSLYLGYLLRFDFFIPPEIQATFLRICGVVVVFKLFWLYHYRQFEGLLSFFSIPDLTRIMYAMLPATMVMLAAWFGFHLQFAPPRSVILADFIFSLMGLAGLRLGFRMIRERYFSSQSRAHPLAHRVGIIGAGSVGASLARELASKPGLGMVPTAFFDDDEHKWGSRVHGIQVVGSPDLLAQERAQFDLDKVVIAMPSASARRIGEIVKTLQKAHVRFETVPALDQLVTGRVKVSHLRQVQIEDLLGRESVELELESIRDTLQGKVVLVTGAGGSIGGELCRQIFSHAPRQLLLLDRSEVQLFQIEQELLEEGATGVIRPLVADILDQARIRSILQTYRPQVIFHAAAHKHVPMMEDQPAEAIRNNTLGTVTLAEAAQEAGVARFVFISTDKAINPTSVMGATKRLAEIFIQALFATKPDGTKFIAVRFGNVLGSSGSVVPVFKQQIATGGPVKVTHAEVTRYFMTIPEAVGLVLQSAAQAGDGGGIFVLDMGKPVKILDLARQLIELSGLKPEEDIKIEFTGLRPGEKLYEEISYRREDVTPTKHPKVMRLVSESQSLVELRPILDDLARKLDQTPAHKLKLLLNQLVPEYKPYLPVKKS